MKLELFRVKSGDDTTLGSLFVDDLFFCYTLEDEVQAVKIYGETAIPVGEYKVGITFSQKFQKDMLAVFDVPGFTGIRIHSGNNADDTLGCILVGTDIESSTRIHGGSKALPLLFNMVHNALHVGREVHLTVGNYPATVSAPTVQKPAQGVV